MRNTFCITQDLPNLIASPRDVTVEKSTHADCRRTLIAKVPVQPGKRYRGSFFFSQLSGSSDAGIALELRLFNNGRQIAHLNNRYLYSFPLLQGTPDAPRYCLDEVQVPKTPGNYELAMEVELSAAAGKFRISSPEITAAPPRLWHRGKYSKGTLNGDPENGKKIMQAYLPTETEVRMVNGIPRVFCNGKIQTLIPVQAGSEEQIKAAYAAGYRIMMVTLPVNNWGRKQGSVWQGKNQYDWNVIDKKLARMAELAPEAKIMLLCYDIAYPGFAEDHPESKWITGDGKTGIKFSSAPPATAFSLSGKTTREECGKFLRELGRHLASTPLGNQIISLHLSAGSDGQWYQPDRPWNYKKLDYSEATRQAVCAEIRKLYRNDLEALRQAWAMPEATFENLQTPTVQELQNESFLLDVKNPRHKRLIDWINADQLALINSIDHLAGEFKAGFGRKVLVTTYAPANRFIDKTALFRTVNLDGAVYLSAYLRPRSSGGNGGNTYPIASAALHKKIIIEEVDYRNEYFGYDGTNRYALIAMADNDTNYMGQLLRAFGANWSRGGSGWLRPINQDSYLAWTGFYERHLKILKNAAALALKHQQKDDYADILYFFSDDYQHQMSRRNNFDHMMDYCATAAPGLTGNGMSHKLYLISDLQNPHRAGGKIFIFPGASAISPENVDYICKNLQKDGNILIFTNDTGRNNPAGFSATLKKLTGINAKLVPQNIVDGIYRADTSIIRDIPAMSFWVRKFDLPQIIIDPAGTEVLAALPSGLPGAVLKKHDNWSAIYIAGTPKNLFSPGFWKFLAGLAEITPAASAGDVNYSGNQVIVLHAVTDGRKTIRTKGKLIDAETGKEVKTTGGKAEFDLKYGETKLLFEVSE